MARLPGRDEGLEGEPAENEDKGQTGEQLETVLQLRRTKIKSYFFSDCTRQSDPIVELEEVRVEEAEGDCKDGAASCHDTIRHAHVAPEVVAQDGLEENRANKLPENIYRGN